MIERRYRRVVAADAIDIARDFRRKPIPASSPGPKYATPATFKNGVTDDSIGGVVSGRSIDTTS